MSRKMLCLGLLLSLTVTAVATQAEDAPAAKPGVKYDFSAWQKLPVLDEGRIKPLDTFAIETVTLVTGRSYWTEQKKDEKDTGAKKRYGAAELLYAWISAPDEWATKPVIRCEYRPLRELLKVPVEGTFVALTDVFDWEKSQKEGKFVYHSPEIEKRFTTLERSAGPMMKRPSEIGDTPADRNLNEKAAELIKHVQAFLGAIKARNLFVVPGLDPRSLTKQTDPDAKTRPWVSLGTVLRLSDWKDEGDPTVAALMAGTPEELATELIFNRVYPPQHVPQLAQAIALQPKLRPLLEAIAPAFNETRKDYDHGQGSPETFAKAMRAFSVKLEDLAHAIDEVRPQMTPPAANAFKFGAIDDRLWPLYEKLELDTNQAKLSAYPAADRTALEVFYNRVQPFYMAVWVFAIATLVVVASMMVKAQRTVYVAGLVLTAGAIAFGTWSFALRIIIAERPPVTNMYETVIWVSYVVAVLGFFFALLPQTWPALQWAWRLTAFPLSWEAAPLSEDQQRMFGAKLHGALGWILSGLRLAGFFWLMWVLTESESSFRVTSWKPPISAVKTLAFGSMMTWLVGLTTVLSASWYVPRVVLTAAITPIMIVTEWGRVRRSFWEGILDNRFFLIGSMSVATLGMLLAHLVGVMSPDIMNPGIGSIAAVLRNNYWLTIHVLTIVSSYGAGALTWGLGNLAMLYYLFGKYRTPEQIADRNKHRPAKSAEVMEPIEEASVADSDTLMSRLKNTGRGLAPGQISKTLKAGFQGAGSGDAHLQSSTVRPPAEVATLAAFGYKGMQVAVLLLAAGTILGGLWADVSWGRFWDWDPKEVWALISLLCYLVFLHGRYAGWVGTFGTNLGSVMCFQAILMSWYGVNFVLPMVHGWWNGTNAPSAVGLHSYATGAGGLGYVITAVVLNLLLVLAAWSRYFVETMSNKHAGTNPSALESTAQLEQPEPVGQA